MESIYSLNDCLYRIIPQIGIVDVVVNKIHENPGVLSWAYLNDSWKSTLGMSKICVIKLMVYANAVIEYEFYKERETISIEIWESWKYHTL